MDGLEVRHLDGLRADTSGATPKLTGYAIRTNVLSENLGGSGRSSRPTAMRAALTRNPDLRALVNHNTDRVVGRLSAKTLRIVQDEAGLRFEVDVPEHERGLVESVARGDVDGASFAFRTLKDAWDETTTPPTRTLVDFELRELSVGVTFPAYPQTDVAALRSLDQHRQSLRRERADVNAQLEHLDGLSRAAVTWGDEVRSEIRRRLTDWSALIGRQPAVARQVLRKLIDGRLTMTPKVTTEGRWYEVNGRASYGPLFAEITRVQGMVPPG